MSSQVKSKIFIAKNTEYHIQKHKRLKTIWVLYDNKVSTVASTEVAQSPKRTAQPSQAAL